jgi:hypothetical protein
VRTGERATLECNINTGMNFIITLMSLNFRNIITNDQENFRKINKNSIAEQGNGNKKVFQYSVYKQCITSSSRITFNLSTRKSSRCKQKAILFEIF